jgi:hypothetical protein
MGDRDMSVQRLALTLVVCLSVTQPSHALPPFRKPLDARYAETDRDLRREFRRANCNLCHVKDKEKKFVNGYGKRLADLIPGNAEDRLAAAASLGKAARDAEYAIVMHELSEAIKKADVLRDPAAVTYGELFRSRQLPAGDESHPLREKGRTEPTP